MWTQAKELGLLLMKLLRHENNTSVLLMCLNVKDSQCIGAASKNDQYERWCQVLQFQQF